MRNEHLSGLSVWTARLLLVSGTFALSMSGVNAQQSDNDSSAEEDGGIEEVVVYGIRASMENAINAKRNANQIMDAISAEDIGKFPDDNIGEALQRITGVSLEREAGEGKSISIRGMGSGLSQVTINGQSMASTEGNRSFNFSVMDSSTVSALEVWKSPTAMQDEGAVGGSVNIVTRGPLDSKRTIAAISVAGQYEDLPEDWQGRYTASFSTQNDAQTIGFSISANDSTRISRSDQIVIPGWTLVDDTSGDWSSRGWDQLAAAEGLDYIAYPMDISSRVRTYERGRTGINPTFQFRFSDNLEVRLDGFYSKLEDFDTNQSFQVRLRDLVRGGGRNVNNYSWEFNGNDVASFDTAGANIRAGWRGLRNIATLRENEWTSGGGRLQLDWNLTDTFRASFQGGANKGSGDLVTYPVVQFQESTGFAIDMRDNPQFPQVAVEDGFTNDQLQLRNLSINDRYNEEDRDFVQLDFQNDINGSHVVAFKFGVKRSGQDLQRTQIRHVSNGGVAGTLADFSAMCGDAPCTVTNNTYAGDTAAPFNGTFAMADFALINAAYPRDTRADRTAYNESWTVSENTAAVYLQLDLEGEIFGGKPYRGNVGLRYYNTNLESSGWLDAVGTEPGIVSRGYHDVLPSLNLSVAMKDNLLLRFGVAEVMARADQEDLSFGGNFNLVDQTAREGNPNLNPFQAMAYDLALEWYFADAGLLSGAVFYKDVDSFISNGVIEGGIIVETETGPIAFDAVGPVNGNGAKIKGIEFGYQQAMDFLPHPFNGFGVQFNYTYTDSTVEFPYVEGGQSFVLPLEGLSKYSFNSVVYYEAERFSMRLAYNYRDSFLANRSNTQGNPQFTDAYAQLDASASFKITDKITIAANAVNLNDEARYQYFMTPDRMLAHRASGRRFSLTVRARF